MNRNDKNKSQHNEELPPLMEEMESVKPSGESDGGSTAEECMTEGSVVDGVEMESEEEGEEGAGATADLRPGYVVELEERLKARETRNLELETKLAQVALSYRKLEEETARFRERLDRERERRIQLDKQKLFRKMLEPLDNLERSLNAARKSDDHSPLAVGVEMVWRQMQESFQAVGLVRFDPGESAFDPQRHEAVGVIPVSGEEQDGKVLQVEQCGYELDGELLRPARVLVGQKAG